MQIEDLQSEYLIEKVYDALMALNTSISQGTELIRSIFIESLMQADLPSPRDELLYIQSNTTALVSTIDAYIKHCESFTFRNNFFPTLEPPKNDNAVAKFKCLHCMQHLMTASEVGIHMDTYHTMYGKCCRICTFRTLSDEQLVHHVVESHFTRGEPVMANSDTTVKSYEEPMQRMRIKHQIIPQQHTRNR
jgi:hypothetical protein